MRTPFLVAALAITLSLPGIAGPAGQASPAPQLPATGTAAISGVVKNGATGRPLADVIVALRAASTGAPLARILRVLTDAQGRFVFRDLPAGDGYSIATIRVGYVDGSYGQHAMLGPSGTINLTAGQWFDQANVLMWKPGAISGRVSDERGDPLVAAYVRVLAQQRIAGQPMLIAGAIARTDDRGEYRIAGLPPGTYLVQVPSVQNTVAADFVPAATGSDPSSSDALARQLLVGAGLPLASRTDAALDLDPANRLVIGNYPTPPAPVNGRAQAYLATFHPGVITPATATSIDLGLGEERRNTDITVRPVPTARITGTVEGPADALAGLFLRLMPAGLEHLVNSGEVATTVVGAGGRFTFLNVPSGSYTIDVHRSTTELTFQSGANGLSLPQAPGSRDGGSQSGTIVSGPPGTGYISRSGAIPDLYWTRVPITVDAADVPNVVVTLQRCMTLSGRLVFEGTTRQVLTAQQGGRAGVAPAGATLIDLTAPLPATMPTVYAEPANGDPTLGRPRSNRSEDADATETFLIDGLRPGPYLLRVPGRVGAFTIKSVTMKGASFSNTPVEMTAGRNVTDVVITFTDKITSIAGTVRSDQGPVSEAAVIAFPVERDQWTRYGFSPSRISATPVSGTSRYQIDGLPAGDYYVVAVEASQITAWQDPAFLEKAATAATRTTLDWGDQRSLELKLARIR